MATEMGPRSRVELLRIAVIILLVVFSFSGWRENVHLMQQINDAQNSLRILHQMQKYSQEVCVVKPPTDMMLMMMKDMDHIRLVKRHPITSKTVCDELTFILMGQTLHCMNDRVSWIKQQYKKANIIVAIHLLFTVLNPESIPKESSQAFYFLGVFNNRSNALNTAIKMVSTKYFLIIDHSVDLARMNSNFVDVLLSNMPGFDILSGAEIVGAKREFKIPCYRLLLKNWSLYESYEYITSGNVLRCDGTSLIFIGRTETFKHPAHKYLFDVNLPSKWLQDFFIRIQGVAEVGVLPEIVIHRLSPGSKCYQDLPPGLSKHVSLFEKMDLLLPFANKYQIFFFHNGTSQDNVCENSGGLVCSEQNINDKWNIGKPSSTGLTTFPFIIKSLQGALHFGAKCLKESNLFYVIEGGTLLGLIKEREILPWDHGDIDTFVYSTRRKIINMVRNTYREHGFAYYLRHTGFHTYMSSDPTSWNGCIVYLSRRIKPKGIIYVRHHGQLFSVKKEVFAFLRELYGSSYFENRMKYTNDRNYCNNPGHHACMPDCRWHGCGGGPGSYPGII